MGTYDTRRGGPLSPDVEDPPCDCCGGDPAICECYELGRPAAEVERLRKARSLGVKHYVFCNPQLIPLTEPNWSNPAIIWLTELDRDEKHLIGCTLAADWNGHKKGALVVCGQIAAYHPFAVLDL